LQLCKAVFEATEVSTPTCFVILPYVLPPPGATMSVEKQQSMLDKAEGWLGTVTSLAEKGTGRIENAAGYAKSFLGPSFKSKMQEVKKKTVEKTLYLYLVDELTHKPGSGGTRTWILSRGASPRGGPRGGGRQTSGGQRRMWSHPRKS
jgi:hypothetical protein